MPRQSIFPLSPVSPGEQSSVREPFKVVSCDAERVSGTPAVRRDDPGEKCHHGGKDDRAANNLARLAYHHGTGCSSKSRVASGGQIESGTACTGQVEGREP